LGGQTFVDVLLPDVRAKEFDALIFVGGAGSAGYFENPDALRLCQEAVSEDRVLAAICIAPAILAQAGCLKAKKATVWSSSFDRSFIKLLKQKGADYQDKAVVSDGKIVTANGPEAARKFTRAIVDII
jgi:protease I